MSSPIEILIVEDDPGDIRLALEVLEEMQLKDRCQVLNSGDEAMDFLRSIGRFANRAPGLPQIILLDLKMPRVNGFEVLEQLKSDKALKRIPVAVLSSSDDQRDIDRARALGADKFVVKGMNFENYRAALRALAQGRHARGQWT
jgi:CheY-like chemotaxis protein